MDEELRRRSRESLKFRFELYKHMSTLDAAVSVVVVALYRDIALDLTTVVTALVAFGVSVLLAIIGMFFNTMSVDLSMDSPDILDVVLTLLCVTAFGIGAVVLLLGALFSTT